MMANTNVMLSLEEALCIAGCGWYTRFVWISCGLASLTGLVNVQATSVVVPALCSLPISYYQKGLLTSMGYFGMLFSSHLFGILSDTIGRRNIIILSAVTTGISTIITGLATNVTTIIVSSFITGFLVGGLFTPVYVYASEFTGQRKRATALQVVTSISVLSLAFLACLAWVILPLDLLLIFGMELRSWRLFLLIVSLLDFTSATVFCFLPDTPKFLLNAGHHDRTIHILRNIYAINQGKREEDYPVVSVTLDAIDKEVEEKVSRASSFLDYCRTMMEQTATIFERKYLFYTAISCCCIVVVSGIYNMMILWLPEESRKLADSMMSADIMNESLCEVMADMRAPTSCSINYQTYTPSLLLASIQFIFLFLATFLVEKFGTKPLMVGLSGVAAVAGLAILYSHQLHLTLVSLVTLLVMLITLFPLTLSVIVTYYPTPLRSTATSIVMLAGRAVSVAGTQLLGAQFYTNCMPAFGVIAATLIGYVVVVLLMPIER